MSAEVYPVFLRLQGRRVVLVGGGRVAAGKLPGLLAAGARVTVIAPQIRSELEQPGVERARRQLFDREPQKHPVDPQLRPHRDRAERRDDLGDTGRLPRLFITDHSVREAWVGLPHPDQGRPLTVF